MKDKSGKTLKDIAEISNIPLSTVQKILNGETQNPNAEAVYNIVKAMGFRMEDLYEENNNVKREDSEDDGNLILCEIYERRIAEIKEQNEKYIEGLNNAHNDYINGLKTAHERHRHTYKRIINVMGVLLAALFFLFLIYFAMDYADKTWGIFFREGLNRQALATTINIISAP